MEKGLHALVCHLNSPTQCLPDILLFSQWSWEADFILIFIFPIKKIEIKYERYKVTPQSHFCGQN